MEFDDSSPAVRINAAEEVEVVAVVAVVVEGS